LYIGIALFHFCSVCISHVVLNPCILTTFHFRFKSPHLSGTLGYSYPNLLAKVSSFVLVCIHTSILCSTPFNTILGRPALYWFMVISHYEYLILKILAPNWVITVHINHKAASVVEMMYDLFTSLVAKEDKEQDVAPLLCSSVPSP
jgi:hypothetical protein